MARPALSGSTKRDGQRSLKIRVLDVSKKELVPRSAPATEFDQSADFRERSTQASRMAGG